LVKFEAKDKTPASFTRTTAVITFVRKEDLEEFSKAFEEGVEMIKTA